ncbi:MAG: hypothetical protein AAFO91_05535, partial [Bacteroidota bacterium]
VQVPDCSVHRIPKPENQDSYNKGLKTYKLTYLAWPTNAGSLITNVLTQKRMFDPTACTPDRSTG